MKIYMEKEGKGGIMIVENDMLEYMFACLCVRCIYETIGGYFSL